MVIFYNVALPLPRISFAFVVYALESLMFFIHVFLKINSLYIPLYFAFLHPLTSAEMTIPIGHVQTLHLLV